MTNNSQEYQHLHNQPASNIHTAECRGAFTLGKLYAGVKGGESAKLRIAYDPDLTDREVLDLQREIWCANRARQAVESIKVNWGYVDPSDPRAEEMEAWNFDEALKTDVWVEVFYMGSCEQCQEEALSRRRLGENIGKVTLVDVEGLAGDLDKTWILSDWPHVTVNGHEVSASKLSQLVTDAIYIRALEARKIAGKSA